MYICLSCLLWLCVSVIWFPVSLCTCSRASLCFSSLSLTTHTHTHTYTYTPLFIEQRKKRAERERQEKRKQEEAAKQEQRKREAQRKQEETRRRNEQVSRQKKEAAAAERARKKQELEQKKQQEKIMTRELSSTVLSSSLLRLRVCVCVCVGFVFVCVCVCMVTCFCDAFSIVPPFEVSCSCFSRSLGHCVSSIHSMFVCVSTTLTRHLLVWLPVSSSREGHRRAKETNPSPVQVAAAHHSNVTMNKPTNTHQPPSPLLAFSVHGLCVRRYLVARRDCCKGDSADRLRLS
jgi:actin-related protein